MLVSKSLISGLPVGAYYIIHMWATDRAVDQC